MQRMSMTWRAGLGEGRRAFSLALSVVVSAPELVVHVPFLREKDEEGRARMILSATILNAIKFFVLSSDRF